MVTYLSVEDILEVHSFVITETGGSHGLRDRASLHALAALPQQQAFGKKLYPTLYDKAAVYVRNIIVSHPFIDGNKRTAMTAAAIFLEDNGHLFSAAEGEVERFALRVISERLDVPDIATWLREKSEKQSS